MPKGGTANGSGGTLAEHVYSAVDVSTRTPRASRPAISLIWSEVKILSTLMYLWAACLIAPTSVFASIRRVSVASPSEISTRYIGKSLPHFPYYLF
jgi:hypothetical protein